VPGPPRLLVNGTTGEWLSQTQTERRLVAENATRWLRLRGRLAGGRRALLRRRAGSDASRLLQEFVDAKRKLCTHRLSRLRPPELREVAEVWLGATRAAESTRLAAWSMPLVIDQTTR
jgi:hypothetical protein